MDQYDPQAIEKKWQRVWKDERAFEVPNPDAGELAALDRGGIRKEIEHPGDSACYPFVLMAQLLT